MQLGKVIGTVWATQKDASLSGEKLQLVQPLTFAQALNGSVFVAVDAIGAGAGDTVLYVTSSEATIPVRERKRLQLAATDATVVGIVDRIDLALPTNPDMI